jgi:chromosomal replication initiation ATPase DnaA
MTKVEKIIAHSLLMYHDTGETSVNREARFVLKMLKKEGFYVKKKFDDSGVIERAVAKVYGIPFENICSNMRLPELVEPRHVGLFFNVISKNETGLSFQKIADKYGKDHASAYTATRKIKGLLSLKHERALRDKVDQIAEITGIDYKQFLGCQEKTE